MLDIQNLTVIFGEDTANEVVALKNFSLRVNKGELVSIRGANGSGKSTIFRAIAGLAPVKQGSIYVNGTSILKWQTHKRTRLVGYVHQDSLLGTCPGLTIHENLRLGSKRPWWSILPENLATDSEVLSLLKSIGLPIYKQINSKVANLSGGQRQVLAVVLAYISPRPLLLLDEATSALDSDVEDSLNRFIVSKAKEIGQTVLVIAHKESFLDKHYTVDVKLNKE